MTWPGLKCGLYNPHVLSASAMCQIPFAQDLQIHVVRVEKAICTVWTNTARTDEELGKRGQNPLCILWFVFCSQIKLLEGQKIIANF